MTLKTYRAGSMAEALTLVKKDLGKDAVILSTRSVKVGGFFGIGAKSRIEITASDQASVMAGRAARAGAAGATKANEPARAPNAQAVGAYRNAERIAGKGAAVSAPAPEGFRPPFIGVETRPDPLAGLQFAAPDATETLQKDRRDVCPTLASVPGEDVPRTMRVRNPRTESGGRAPAFTTPAPSDLYRELADIKLLVNQVLHSAGPIGAGAAMTCNAAMPEALFRQYLRLLEAQVSRDIADSIIGAVRDELTPGELGDEQIVRTSVLRHLAGLLPVDERVSQPAREEGRPRIIALVGPTGVGKTTTTAKLAAAYKLRHGRSVALITSDTYRIAAVDQLRTYASIIGLPLKVVMTPEEMAEAVRSLADYDVILIDTAGRSQHNTDRLEELAAFLGAARPHETHLVLSSATSEAVMVRTAQAFSTTRPDHILLTKLDEAVNFGVLVNVMQRVTRELASPGGESAGVPLSFVTTGQEVPDHIEAGQADRLARMVLDNRLVMKETATAR